MEIKLKKLILENVKGIKSFEFPPDGRDALIRSENGEGKTTVADGFHWLVSDNDSEGRSDFSIRPLDENNEPVKGLVVATEGELLINGESHVLRKEQHEKIVKKEIKGYETVCFIDEVPKKVSEYQEFIENLCPREILKMLTDLAYFNSKMHWSARRKVLLDIAGKIPKPAGFEALLANLNGRDIDDYKKVLIDRKKAYTKEREGIEPGINELQRLFENYVQDADEAKLQKQRDGVQQTIDALNKQRTELLAAEKQRQQTIDQINHLTVERLHRESCLKHQSGPRDDLITEKGNLENDYAEKHQELFNVQNTIRELQTNIKSIENQIAQLQVILESIREEFKQADSPDCPTCGQKWPENKPKPGQADITRRGNEAKIVIDLYKCEKVEHENALIKLISDEKSMREELKSAETKKNKRIAEIDKALKKPIEVDPSTDEQWQKFTADIDKLQTQLGQPASLQLDIIETNVKTAQEKLNDINKSLAQADNAKKAKTRIEELENHEQELAQLIADTEKEIDQIQQYKMQESRMISAAVNGKFRHVEFKLFDYYLNGEINDKVCEAVYQGVPYPDMSSGQKIYCGIDIVNTLSDHYGVSVPLFIDHAESVTMPIEAESQTIRLQAVKGIKKLQVEIEQEAGKAVAS